MVQSLEWLLRTEPYCVRKLDDQGHEPDLSGIPLRAERSGMMWQLAIDAMDFQGGSCC